MTYKDNQPTFNINRKVVNFKDFNKDAEKEELEKLKRQNKPNSERQQLLEGNLELPTGFGKRSLISDKKIFTIFRELGQISQRYDNL